MDEYIKKSEAVDVIVKYPYDIAGKTATAIKMIEDLPSADVVPNGEVEKLNAEIEVLKAERNNYQTWYFQTVTEIETLKDNNEHLAVMLEETRIELEAMRGAANSLKMHYEKAEAEVRRLRGILLQFTDIVHKWGAKNNIDTSEISLVPILQQEADSIIKKANQELARELFAEIETLLALNILVGDVFTGKYFDVDLENDLAELKKKYTEIEVEN